MNVSAKLLRYLLRIQNYRGTFVSLLHGFSSVIDLYRASLEVTAGI